MAKDTFYTYYDTEGKGINPAHISDYKTSIIFDAYNRTIYAQEGQYGNHYVGTYNGERFVSYHGETFNDFNHNNAYGDYSSAFGTYTTAYNKGEAAFGYHNLSTYNKSLFTIGYGTAENPANIIDVHNNGNTYINNFNISRAIPHLVQTTLEFGRYYIWVGDETELPASDERFENVIYFVSDDKPTTGLIYPEDDYRQQYLTFIPLSNSTFSFSGNNIQYKIDDGNWTTLTAGTNTPEVAVGSKISWRGNLTSTGNGIGKFTSSANFDVKGNIMSLLYGDDFIDNTEISDNVFKQLFKNCNYLVNAKYLYLPSKTLAENCYAYMFNGCTSLITAPKLPATTLADSCYDSMFQGCTGLTAAPYLPASELVSNCYREMFYGCSSLTEIIADFKTTPGSTYTYDWVNGVADSGIFYKNPDATWENEYGSSYIPKTDEHRWTVIDKDEPQIDSSDAIANQCLILSTPNLFADDTYININIPAGLGNKIKKIAYSYGPQDNWNWQVKTITSADDIQIYFNNQGTNYNTLYILMKGTGTAISDTVYSCITFENTGIHNCTISGNVMALACDDNWKPKTSIEYNYQFCGLFNSVKNANMTVEIDADPDYKGLLPAKSLKPYCYCKMFQGCTGLTSAPTLPATKLVEGCYEEMFSGCSSLKEIHAEFTTEPGPTYTYDWVANVAYPGTFYKNPTASWANRYGYTYIPLTDAQPWDVRGGAVTYTYITTVIDQATQGNSGNGDISFYIPNGFPKQYNNGNSGYITEVAYSDDGGSTWTEYKRTDTSEKIITVPVLGGNEVYWRIKGGGTGGDGNSYCYFNCDSNNTFTVKGNIMSLACDENWKHGEDIKNKYQFAGLFKNSRITSCDKKFLPAKILANGCYQSMFKGCNQLTSAPELPAINLIDVSTSEYPYFMDCYKEMFSGCLQLSQITALFVTNPHNAQTAQTYPCTTNWVAQVAGTGTFTYNDTLRDTDWINTLTDIELYNISLIPPGWTLTKDTSTQNTTNEDDIDDNGSGTSPTHGGSTGGGGNNDGGEPDPNEDPNSNGEVEDDDPIEGGGLENDNGDNTGGTNTGDNTEDLPHFECIGCGEQITEYPCTYCGCEGEPSEEPQNPVDPDNPDEPQEPEQELFECPDCGEQITEYPCQYCGYTEEVQEEIPDDEEQVHDVLYELAFYLDGETIKMDSECAPSSVDIADVYYLLNNDNITYKVTDTLEHFANGVTINNIYDLSSVYVERRSVENPGVLYEATWSVKGPEEDTP